MKADRTFLLVLLCFLFSGFAALLYQTAWTRQFAFVFGTSELAIATVLAAYMGGLAAGAAAAGRIAHRIRRPVLVYGLLELGIGLSALALPAAIATSTRVCVLLFGQEGSPPDAGGLSITMFYLGSSFLILLIPTALMGATLPLLARYAVRSDDELGGRIGLLYAINTLGAILGTLVAGFFLLPAIGLFRTVLVGVFVNFLVFLIAALLARSHTALPRVSGPSGSRFAWRRADVVLVLILFSGVTSFAYEVLWARLFNQILGGSVYAFSTMLASFLTGITLGSALASRFATSKERAVLGFGLTQLGIAVFSLLAFAGLDHLPAWVTGWESASGGVRLSDILITGGLILPSTLAIGATFPFAVRITARGEADAGPASARVYAWNTLGAIAGAVGAGFFLIPALGFAGCMAVAVVLNLLLAAASAMLVRPARKLLLMGAAACAVLLVVLPPQTPWKLLRFSPLSRQILQGRLTFAEVGRSATVLMLWRNGQWKVSSNGLPESGISDADDSSSDLTNRWIGALPSMARPATKSMLVVGFGGGQVVEDVPRSVKQIHVIELEPAVIEANQTISKERFSDPLVDPRIQVIVNDARGALVLTERKYDAIVSQPSHAWTAGASHLYTREFFQLVKDHLEPGGVFVQWIGAGFVNERLLQVLVATLRDVYPYVRVYRPPPWGAVLFLASDEPLPVEETVSEAIAASPRSFRRMGIQTPEDVAISLTLDERAARNFSQSAPVSTDDRNLLQMESPRILGHGLKAAGADCVFAPLDPIHRIAASLDRVLLADRTLQRRALFVDCKRQPCALDRTLQLCVSPVVNMRLGLLMDAAESDAERKLMRALALAAKGQPVLALAEIEPLRSGMGREAQRAEALRARWTRSQIARGEGGAGDPGQYRDESVRAVVKGWKVDKGAALRRLEPQLAAVGPEDLLYASAIRLRARWRVATGQRDLAQEAVDLLNGIAVGTNGTSLDFILRARAAIVAEDRPTALRSLDEALTRSSKSDLAYIQAVMKTLPKVGPYAVRVEALRRKLSKHLQERL